MPLAARGAAILILQRQFVTAASNRIQRVECRLFRPPLFRPPRKPSYSPREAFEAIMVPTRSPLMAR